MKDRFEDAVNRCFEEKPELKDSDIFTVFVKNPNGDGDLVAFNGTLIEVLSTFGVLAAEFMAMDDADVMTIVKRKKHLDDVIKHAAEVAINEREEEKGFCEYGAELIEALEELLKSMKESVKNEELKEGN